MYRRYSATITLFVMIVLGLALLSTSASAQEQTDQDFVNRVRELEELRGELAKQRTELEMKRKTLDLRLQELESVSKVFEIKYANVRDLSSVLQIFGGQVSDNEKLNIISVRGPEDTVTAIEGTIERLDVPPPATKNIVLTVHMLQALAQYDSTEEASSTMLPELEPVVRELATVFGYAEFRLLETVMLRCRDGGPGTVSGSLTIVPEQQRIDYKLEFNAAKIVLPETGPDVIRIDDFEFQASAQSVSPPTGPAASGPVRAAVLRQARATTTSLDADLDVREGQKVVVGKASVDSSPNALFVVVTATVVD